MRCFVLLSLVAFCSCTPLGVVLQDEVIPKKMMEQQILNKQFIEQAQKDPIAIKQEIMSEVPISGSMAERVVLKKPMVPLSVEGLYGRQGVKVGNTIVKVPTLPEAYLMGSMGYPVPMTLKEQILNEVPMNQMGEYQIVDRLVMEKPALPAKLEGVSGKSGIKVDDTILKTPAMGYPYMMQYPGMMKMMENYPFMMQYYPKMMQYYPQMIPYSYQMQYPQSYYGQYLYPQMMYQQYQRMPFY